MLFQPSNIAPSTLSGIGIGTVDVTQGLDVSWQVNGDSPMTSYQITIYQNDSASTQLYTTGEIALLTPFQPHDAQGNPQFFSTTISAATLSTAGIVNGYANGYKIIIKQWWSANDYVEQTSASVFITRTTPTLSIDAIANPVTTSSLTITATYAQAEGDPVSTVEWVFALAGQEDTPIKQTGAVSTQILSFDVDGLITGTTYSVMCNVVTSNGMEVSTGFVPFSVSYIATAVTLDYQLAQMRNSSAVYLSWQAFENNILPYPYEDSTKTTNGITFTVNGEGDVSASGTASADAYFDIAEGTLSDLSLTAGQKMLVTSGYNGAVIVVKETNSSNVVVSTITGGDPLQYIVPSTTNTLTFSIVIPNGTVLSPAATMSPMLYLEDRIEKLVSLSADITPTQSGSGTPSPSNPRPISGHTEATIYLSPTLNVSDANTYNIDWVSGAGTVYGGSLDVITGTLTVTMAYVDLGSLTWTKNSENTYIQDWRSTGISSDVKKIASNVVPNGYCTQFEVRSRNGQNNVPYTIGITAGGNIAANSATGEYANATAFKAGVNGVLLVYELATPVTYQVSKASLSVLAGQNNIWADTGSVIVTYTTDVGTQNIVSGQTVTFSDTNAVVIPKPEYSPGASGISGVSVYRQEDGEPILRHVYDFDPDTSSLLDYFAPSQKKVSYLIAFHRTGSDMFAQTSQFTPTFWFYSVLLCSQDSSGFYHVRSEYVFKYGVETGTVSNNNAPSLQQNFTKYPTRQPVNSLYKTGSLKGYIGKVSDNKIYSDTVSLQNSIYDISVSTLTKFLKTRKGETIMVDCSSPIQMQTGDNMVQQPLVATITWAEVGDSSEESIVSVPTDSFWPL